MFGRWASVTILPIQSSKLGFVIDQIPWMIILSDRGSSFNTTFMSCFSEIVFPHAVSCLSSFSTASVVVRSLLFSLFVVHFEYLLLGILHVS